MCSLKFIPKLYTLPLPGQLVGMVYSFVLNSNVHMICGDSVAKARCLFISVCSLELVPKLYTILDAFGVVNFFVVNFNVLTIS